MNYLSAYLRGNLSIKNNEFDRTFFLIKNWSIYYLRPLHNPYLFKDDGLFFSSKAPGLVF